MSYLDQFNSANFDQRPVREMALQRFLEQGFPTRRDEAWKYTDLSFLENSAFEIALQKKISDLHFNALPDSYQIVFVNGFFQTQLSRLEGLEKSISPLCEVVQKNPQLLQEQFAKSSSLVDLNSAFVQDGVVLHLTKNMRLDKPLHILFLSVKDSAQSLFYTPRNIFILDAQTEATIVEEHVALDDVQYFKNFVLKIELGENANLNYYKIQHENSASIHYALTQVSQKRDSQFRSHSISLGSQLARDDLNISLIESGAACYLNGLYLASGKQHIDHHTRIEHIASHCQSEEYYKGILDDESTGVFNGKVIVHPQAQKTASQQSNKNLLLSSKAEVNTKPELEIYADDVKCTHGATVGQIDEESLFYLRARGIDEVSARKILIEAFAIDVVDRIADAKIAEYVAGILERRIKK